MRTRETRLPKKYHDAVERWRETFIPDYDFLMKNWEKHFPKEPQFKLCAYRELKMCDEVECGEHEGKPKATRARDLTDEQAQYLLGAIRAQASTEFGSIQQHRLTLSRAQSEEEQVWILRMMADELRHGYQMLHLLQEDEDWAAISGMSVSDMVEETLQMQTGSHLLGAFNIDFDSFTDNVVFCGLIDRVGKYQLAMQKVSAYKPMAESMPKMLREEAFHLATGVVPMRRWVEAAAKGQQFVTMEDLNRVINKWFPRALEMFGDERGGASNVRMGLKPMENGQAQADYAAEVQKLVDDLNMRYIRTKLPELGRNEAKAVYEKLTTERETTKGITWAELIKLPHHSFFRRRGVPAFTMVGHDGEKFDNVNDYVTHLRKHLPHSYFAGRDFLDYQTTLEMVASGEIDEAAGARRMPELRRVAGACPCSKSVRWVREESITAANDEDLAVAGG